TATHASRARHDTPCRSPSRGFGPVTIAQVVPFQRSVSGYPRRVVLALPTLRHTPGSGHDTPSSTLLSTPEASGLSRIGQAVPFHFSTNVRGCNVGGNIVLSPTAKHSLSLTHETPVSSSRGWSEGCGGSSFQIAPVHRAAMTFGPPLSATPTAMHD